MKIPNTPFSTRLSGSAKETELRLRSIFQWKKKRPPVILLILVAVLLLGICGGLVGFASTPERISEDPFVETGPDEGLEEDGDTELTVSETTPTEPEISREQFGQLLNEHMSSYTRSALLDGRTLLVPEMQLSALPEWYRRTLTLTQEDGKLLEGEPYRDQTVIRTYENNNVVIETIAFLYDAILADGSKPEDASVQYIYSITAKNNQVISLLSGMSIGDLCPFGADGSYAAEGRPCLEYSYEGKRITGLRARAIRDMETYRYADLSDLGLLRDGRMVVLGSSLPLYAQRVADIPVTDATQEVLTCVDAIYQAGMVDLWGFLLPGTGPIAVTMDDFYEEVYNLFAGYKWIRWDGETPQKVDDKRTFYFTSAGNTTIVLDDKRAYINVMEGNSTGGWNTWYYAENEDGELLSALINLWGGPDLYHAMFRYLDQIDNDQELAETYVKWFREYYLSTGAIEDIRWHETTIQDSGEAYLRILVRYSVKPTDQTNPAWRYYTVSEDGWVDVALSIALEKTAPHQVSSYQSP